jgi:hypothetical protein
MECEKGYHYHPKHPKANANGCMKDGDMGQREHFKGTTSIYNAIRNWGYIKSNDRTSYIGV